MTVGAGQRLAASLWRKVRFLNRKGHSLLRAKVGCLVLRGSRSNPTGTLNCFCSDPCWTEQTPLPHPRRTSSVPPSPLNFRKGWRLSFFNLPARTLGVDMFLNLNSLAHPWSLVFTALSLGGHLSPRELKVSYVYRISDGSPSRPPVLLSQPSVHHRSVHQHTLPTLFSAF